MADIGEIPLRRDFELSARISLYAPGQARIDLVADPEPEDSPFAEQLLYCCMALRQLVNMTGYPPAHTLEDFLRTAASQPDPSLEHIDQRPVTFVDKERRRAKIVFPARLFLQQGELGFTVRLARSTILMKDLLKYASQSVPALYYFLSDRRFHNKEYIKQLTLIGWLCAYASHSGKLNVQNQLPGAVTIVLGLRAGKYGPLEDNLSKFWQDA